MPNSPMPPSASPVAMNENGTQTIVCSPGRPQSLECITEISP